MPTVDGVTHSWVEARGLRFHVAEAGSGDDTVLLLHGWPQHWYEWRELMLRAGEVDHPTVYFLKDGEQVSR